MLTIILQKDESEQKNTLKNRMSDEAHSASVLLRLLPERLSSLM